MKAFKAYPSNSGSLGQYYAAYDRSTPLKCNTVEFDDFGTFDTAQFCFVAPYPIRLDTDTTLLFNNPPSGYFLSATLVKNQLGTSGGALGGDIAVENLPIYNPSGNLPISLQVRQTIDLAKGDKLWTVPVVAVGAGCNLTLSTATNGNVTTNYFTGKEIPWELKEYVPPGNTKGNWGNNRIASKTLADVDLTQNNCVIPIFGQSNTCNLMPTAYTPVSADVLNFNIYDGKTYVADGPLLGCSNAALPGYGTGNAYTLLGDLIAGTGMFDKVILAPAGIGGTYISQWENDQFNRINATAAALAKAGLTATAVLVQQGEADNVAGTSQAAYQAAMTKTIAKIRGAFGATVPIFIAKSSWVNGAVSTAVTTAQGNVVSAPAKIIAGPNMDTLGATKRVADNTHLNDAGAADLSALWLTSLQAYGAPFI